MSVLDPPTVLLDATFIAALTNHDEPFHGEAVATYADLLDRYERAEVLLGATSDALEPLAQSIRTSLFSPVTTVTIAEQHRNAALDVAGPSAADPDLATLLVILRREKIRCVASFDRRLDRFDIEIIPAHPRDLPTDPAGNGEPVADGGGPMQQPDGTVDARPRAGPDPDDRHLGPSVEGPQTPH